MSNLGKCMDLLQSLNVAELQQLVAAAGARLASAGGGFRGRGRRGRGGAKGAEEKEASKVSVFAAWPEYKAFVSARKAVEAEAKAQKCAFKDVKSPAMGRYMAARDLFFARKAKEAVSGSGKTAPEKTGSSQGGEQKEKAPSKGSSGSGSGGSDATASQEFPSATG